ncbi:propionyl-coenzyme A carboxylase alpha polypeptide [Mesorhizobium sp. M2E.F.Ca.ET.166.01.1.1]|nr:propionyl-coenzyme A carboxylase alpha polypeptide [Mesorhizobium sp. M2E.F.Ca.ET.219.01.1.1]TGS10116.1 propionyl-coenzyme A carboxylase alpha polypeptide [Mesorhizobium sp. M2E.F.Ca.ET.209.01.1.1]TGT78023.1 propionyl-coenzyme A carboxylase alpha polypeptide [Mesorhizobium sp. M2E.F.Ca.ET.166.01.1.1]TGW04141.1 propionyl-coenzyme A carboxylase alpha polypeptide [Mesorhizobium sp. M2E.F.Ca.ET.154.01.1.1]
MPDISPQGGRSAVTPAFANLQRCRKGEAPKLPISPLEGEMSGRTERGASRRRRPISFPQNLH